VSTAAARAMGVVDTVHSGLSGGVLGAAERLDGFLGERLLQDYKQNSMVRVNLRADVADRTVNFSPQVNVRLVMPRTVKRLHLIVDRYQREEINQNNISKTVTDIEDRIEKGGQNRQGTFVGMRYMTGAVKSAREFLDFGVSTRSREPFLNPFARFSLARSRQVGKCAARLDNQAHWDYKTDVGASSALDFKRPWTDGFFTRSTSQLLWRSNQFGVQFVQALTLHWMMSDRDAFSPSAQAIGHTYPATGMDAYVVTLSYRRSLRGRWLFLQLSPEADYPRDKRFAFSPRLGMGLEIIFGGDG
jgi:hypothetical protein